MKKLLNVLIVIIFLFLINTSNSQWNNTKKISGSVGAYTTSYYNAKCVASSGNNIYLIWINEDNKLLFRRSTDNGSCWDSTKVIAVNPNVNATPTITASDQNVYVIWDVYKAGLFYINSLDEGLTWGEIKCIMKSNRKQITDLSATSNENVIHIACTDLLDGSSYLSCIYFVQSFDNGQTWSQKSLCSTLDPPISFSNPSIFCFGKEVYISWDNGAEISIAKFNDECSNFEWQKKVRKSEYIGEPVSTKPSISVFEKNIYIVWEKDLATIKGINFIKSTDGGISWSSEKEIFGEEKSQLPSHGNTDPSLLSYDNIIYLLYSSYDEKGISYFGIITSTDAGNTWGYYDKGISNSPISAIHPSMCMSNSKIHIIYNGLERSDWKSVYYNNFTSFFIKEKLNPELKLIDIDGNEYKTIIISGMEWMTENLKVSRYSNGDLIPQVTDPSKWKDLTTGAWCYYNNKSNNGERMGKLYNYYAITDPRGLAPKGWHISDLSEWDRLSKYYGGDEISGEKLKANIMWNTSGKIAYNENIFLALPCGSRDYSGNFSGTGEYARFWTYDKRCQILSDKSKKLTGLYEDKRYGFSIRCVRDN